MAINKKLIHFETFSNFNSQKLSANKENTQYTLGIDGEIQTGSPDILYQSIVYIKDTKQQWTHGQLYISSANIEAVDTSETLDDVETNTYVKYVAQSLTDEQKLQVKQNLGISENTDLSETYIYDISERAISAGIGSINGINLWTDLDSGKNPTNFTFKTVNGESLLGEGDITISGGNEITESTVSGWGFTKNTGTITGAIINGVTDVMVNPLGKLMLNPFVVDVKMNGNSKLLPDGIVDLGTVITSHQDISGKQDKLVSGTNIKTINGTSILGSGDITIQSGGGSGVYALVEHGTNDTTFTLTPNTFHVWGEVTSLTLTFGEEQSGVANEYLFQFESGSEATTLTLPDNLIWANDEIPVIESNYTYQVSILKGFATLMKFGKKNIGLYFSIDGTKYQVEDGMTWRDWVNSEYNTDGYFISGLGTMPVYNPDGTKIVYMSNNYILSDEYIIPQVNYTTS